MKYREIGDVPFGAWEDEFSRYPTSPLIPKARAIYDISKGHTALSYMHLKRESELETVRDKLSPEDNNPYNLRPNHLFPAKGATGEKNGYLTFDSVESAAREWRRRVIDDPDYYRLLGDGRKVRYRPDMTLEQYIEAYAPLGDRHETTGDANETYYDDAVSILTRILAWKEEQPVAVKFEKRLATNRYDEFGALANQAAAYFTIHENGNSNSSPYDEAAFVRSGGGSERVMYQFAVGVENGGPIIVQIFPVNKRGKHAGNATGNSSSAAVEVTQAPPGALSDMTQEALQELLYMIYTGDERIEGIENVKFSPDRTLGHKDWRGANPRCPQYMTQAWGGVEPVVAKARARLTANPNPGPGPKPIPGVPEVIPFLFGAADGFKFDPNGTISKDWLKRGEATGSYPRLVGVHEAKHGDVTIRYFQFSSGLVISANLKTGVVGPWKYVP